MSKKNSIFRDYIELSKPRITFFCLLMTAGGAFLSPENITIFSFLMTLIGTSFSVAAANTFNMVYERETDKLMKRTRFRPIASGRVKASHALIFALIIGALGLFILLKYVNLLTAILSFLAIFSYSLIYTPLKYFTPLALVIGAFPGAMPPLLGWTAVTNSLDISGLSLFFVLFAWQMPHFIAIAIYYKEDYTKAGIKVVSSVRGDQNAKIQAFIWSIVLFISSLMLVPLNVAGAVYLIVSVTLGFWFLWLGYLGIKKDCPQNWPRKFFLASLIYLPILVLAIVADKFFWTILGK